MGGLGGNSQRLSESFLCMLWRMVVPGASEKAGLGYSLHF